MPHELVTRPATADDIDALLANLRAGFESYVEFAPPGWAPPELDPEPVLRRLREPGTWALLATAGGQSIAHVSFTPARGRVPHRAQRPSAA